nr:L-2-hydroxyglutarate oxidase [Raoultella sp. NCTC 9187]
MACGRPRTGGFSARQADRRFSVRHHRALHSYLQCTLPGGHIGSAIGAHIVGKVQALLARQHNPGRSLRAARSADSVLAEYTR